MKEWIALLAAIGALVGLYGWILCKTADKPTPKPGKDYDERGPY